MAPRILRRDRKVLTRQDASFKPAIKMEGQEDISETVNGREIIISNLVDRGMYLPDVVWSSDAYGFCYPLPPVTYYLWRSSQPDHENREWKIPVVGGALPIHSAYRNLLSSGLGALGEDEIPSFGRWQEIVSGLCSDEAVEGQSLFSAPLLKRVEELYSKITGPNDDKF